MNRQPRFSSLVLAILLVLNLACSEEETIKAPIITTIDPSSGFPSMKLKIKGDGFSSDPSDNVVEFNGIKAHVDSAKNSELVVTVPENAISGSISVSTKGGLTSFNDFKCYDIIVAGTETKKLEKSIVKIWRNTIPESITDGSLTSSVTAFTTSNNNYYLSGYIFDGAKTIPVYWVNKSATILPYGKNGIAWDIAVSENTVHTAGMDYEESRYIPKYWNNETGNNLSLNSGEGYNENASGISIENNIVYICGHTYKNDVGVGVIWKDKIPQELGDGITSTYVNDIQVVNNITHAVGITVPSSSSNPKITYWQNGNPTYLTDGTNYAYASLIKVVDNDVLIYGIEMNSNGFPVSKLWINGHASILSDQGTPLNISGISVHGTDIIFAGTFNVPGLDQGIVFFAINDKMYFLTDGDSNVSTAGLIVREL